MGAFFLKLKVKIEPDVFGLVYCIQKMQKLLLHVFLKVPIPQNDAHTRAKNRSELTVGPVAPV